jgi:subtilisin family serine protease
MHHSLRLGAIAAVLVVSSLPCAAQGRPDLVEQSLRDPARQYMPAQMLVQFRRDTDSSTQAAALAFAGASRAETVRAQDARANGKGDLHLLRLPPGRAVADAVRSMGQLAEVEFAEPNWIYQHQATSNDPSYLNGSLWGMYGDASSPANAYGSQAAEAWARNNTCSSGVYVGIIDEGVMHTHPDLAANVDAALGWDFVGNDSQPFDGVDDDHGTHVAGTIGATGGNGQGVAGVCWAIKMISAKFLGKRGGTTANAIRAVDYLTDLKRLQGVNVVATNNSWGGGGFSQALQDAIDRAGAQNILFVAAAGNSAVNNDSSPHYPSSYSSANIISVASITNTGALSSFSNYGANSVDLGAPGSGILSTVPMRSGKNVVAGYATYSGTSMATPHVTGAVAMYASSHPGATPAQIKDAIVAAGVATPSLAGRTVTGRRLNVSGF